MLDNDVHRLLCGIRAALDRPRGAREARRIVEAAIRGLESPAPDTIHVGPEWTDPPSADLEAGRRATWVRATSVPPEPTPEERVRQYAASLGVEWRP